jgi:amino acid transporter
MKTTRARRVRRAALLAVSAVSVAATVLVAGASRAVVFAMAREQALPGSLTRLSGRRTPVVAIGCLTVITLLLGLPVTYAYGGARAFGYLAGAGGLAVVLVYLTGNIAVIRAFRTEFRDEFSFWRHLLIPAMAVVIFLFPL